MLQAVGMLKCILEKSVDHMPHHMHSSFGREGGVEGSTSHFSVERDTPQGQCNKHCVWVEKSIYFEYQQNQEIELS